MPANKTLTPPLTKKKKNEQTNKTKQNKKHLKIKHLPILCFTHQVKSTFQKINSETKFCNMIYFDFKKSTFLFLKCILDLEI